MSEDSSDESSSSPAESPAVDAQEFLCWIDDKVTRLSAYVDGHDAEQPDNDWAQQEVELEGETNPVLHQGETSSEFTFMGSQLTAMDLAEATN